MPFFLMIVSYLLGSIPFGLLLTKYIGGIDVRTIGSGNIGATNVLRSGNKKIAAATLLLDALKGTVPVLLAQYFTQDPLLPYACGLFAILGHVFPVWLKFNGGKGVATALGVLLPLHSLLFLSVLATWLIIAKLFRISSLSAIIAFALSPLYAYFINQNMMLFLFCSLLAVLLLYTHRSNIKKLIKGEERSF